MASMVDFYGNEVKVGDKVLTYYLGLPNNHTMAEGIIKKIGKSNVNDEEYDGRDWATVEVPVKGVHTVFHVSIFRTGKEIVKI